MIDNEHLKQIIYYKTIDGLYGDHKKLSNSLLSELRFFVSKGYRVYYKDLTNVVIIIIAGSDKNDQKRVIKQAEKYLKDFIERNSK